MTGMPHDVSRAGCYRRPVRGCRLDFGCCLYYSEVDSERMNTTDQGDQMDENTLPGRDSLIKALELVGRTPDGMSLELTDEERLLADPALLVGMLDAAVHVLAESHCSGKGKSRRHKVVLGYRRYLAHTSEPRQNLMEFFQTRLARLAGDMRTSLNDPHDASS